jgi:hypothetical protein
MTNYERQSLIDTIQNQLAWLPKPAARPRYIVGLDLGQRRDFTAIAVLDRTETVYPDRRDPVTWAIPREVRYTVAHLERLPLGTAYTDIVSHVKSLLSEPLLAGAALVVDATGAGLPVVDMLRQAIARTPLIPVMITSGDRTTEDNGVWKVPKKDLIAGLQILFETSQLGIAAGIPQAETLIEELCNFELTVSLSGHQHFQPHRAGAHDDLVLAVALAAWQHKRAEK